jgi:hypothetical protein
VSTPPNVSAPLIVFSVVVVDGSNRMPISSVEIVPCSNNQG